MSDSFQKDEDVLVDTHDGKTESARVIADEGERVVVLFHGCEASDSVNRERVHRSHVETKWGGVND